ncbi:MAG TPA: alpha-E domain-containing protein [Sporichthyaceae bacterium]|nr:alpha-E domain-containing protein [Sporichthyaceae bacterium]
MLSRIAESVFWIGRYLERADCTARILDVHVQMLVEDPWVDERVVCSSLMEVMGVDAPDDVEVTTAGQVLAALAYDLGNSSAIAGSISAARENARGARETISAEIFEALNATWMGLGERRRVADRLGPHGFFSWVRERTGVLGGLVDATMSRDEGWTFLTLGRALERADMTARLLMLRTLPGGRAPTWGTLLRSCGSYESYLRTYRGPVRDHLAAEFLMVDRLSPRSLFCSLSTAEACLAALDPSAARSGFDDTGRLLLGRARTDLEFRSRGDLLSEFSTHLEGLQETCSAVADAVARRYFPHVAPVTWTAELIS